jgi:hypothetical protein
VPQGTKGNRHETYSANQPKQNKSLKTHEKTERKQGKKHTKTIQNSKFNV